MIRGSVLPALVSAVVDEWDSNAALGKLAAAVLEHTNSRNAMFARMNDELGKVELRNGAGADWSEDASRLDIELTTDPGQGIVAYVAATGKPFITNNVAAEPRYRQLFASSRSEIAVPINGRDGRIRAVLNVESDREDNYDDEDLRLCEFIGQLARIAIEREEVHRREEALIQIGTSLDRALTEGDLIERVLEVATDVLKFLSCSVYLWEPSEGKFMLRGAVGPLSERVGQIGYKPGEGLTGWVAENGEPIMLDRPQSDPRWLGHILEIEPDQIAGFLAVPVVYRGRSIGALRVIRRKTANAFQNNRFTADDKRLLVTIAEQVAVGLENIRSVRKAIGVERMAAWGELSAKSSHMIGNRVFALRGDVNELGFLVEEDELDRAELRAIHKSLSANVTRIDEILHDFRDFLTATQLKREPTDLNALVRSAVDGIFPKRSDIRLAYELSEGISELLVDPRKLTRAITEVVENALSFLETGTLWVRTGEAEPEMVRRLGVRSASGRFACIEIEDQGPGVGAESKQRIFEPFYSSRVKGMGLGLSIVKGILDAHGGTVAETGIEGQGARFVMLLPIDARP